jgi:hypothetical protein
MDHFSLLKAALGAHYKISIFVTILSPFARRAGFVISRQKFVRRCHALR